MSRRSPTIIESVRKQSFADRLAAGELLVGAGVSLADPFVTELLSSSFSWLFVDMEHAPLSLHDIEGIAIAAARNSTPALVRVPVNEPVVIKQVLDIGVDGVIVPQVNSRVDARLAVAAALYPPEGVRGFGPRRASSVGRDVSYVPTANETVAVVVQIESLTAVQGLEEIVATPGVTGVLIGPSDLAATLGHLGHDTHPDVEDQVDRVISACRAQGMPVGVAIGHDASRARKLMDRGVQFLCVGGDVGYMVHAADALVEALEGSRR